jgi:hypothetical protein
MKCIQKIEKNYKNQIWVLHYLIQESVIKQESALSFLLSILILK